MNFRGSTFMPDGRSEPTDAVWYEAHQRNDGQVIVAKLQGSPSDIGRPGFFERRRRKAPTNTKTYPTSGATVIKTVDTPLDALRVIFEQEQAQLAAKAQFIDIGELSGRQFGGLEHYIHVAEFASAVCPVPIAQAAGDFVAKLGVRFAFIGDVPRSMYEKARETVKWYHEHRDNSPQGAAA